MSATPAASPDTPGDVHWAATTWEQIEKDLLYDEYPDPHEYDFESIHLRSETRDLARRFYEGDDNPSWREVNRYAAAFVDDLLSPLLEDAIRVTTSQHDERVLIVNKESADRDAIKMTGYPPRMRERLPWAGGKRHYCNEFRDAMIGIVAEIIDEVHKLLAGFGVPPLPPEDI